MQTKRRFLSVILSLVLILTMPFTAFAMEQPQIPEESYSEEVQTDGVESLQEKETESLEESVDSSVWTASDFTYTTITQTLNGCDYTRQFQISGPAIAGFSESGEEKLKTNKNLVIPSENDKGEMLAGVAENAFYDKGLESVAFPEGMMVDYDDTVTHVVTRRGNFIIASGAFSKNNLTSVTLPEGVIAVMSSAFRDNQLREVTFPHTIWWIENSSFARNNLMTVGFPKTCDFQVQIHGFSFAQNQIRTVRLPDYTEVVDKNAFVFNPGAEECPADAPEKDKTQGGVVYMYTDNENLAKMERIHHIERSAESQHSWHQKLIIGSRPAEDGEWSVEDFTIDGTTITGLSESGIEKRAVNKALILPDKNASGQNITALADTTSSTGLFASAEEKFNSLVLPLYIERIGQRAFVNSGLTGSIKFPLTLKEIGLAAFQNNSLTSVALPDSVTKLGEGAFSTNPKLSTIVISKGLTEIAAGAFGCSDKNNWMENLTQLVIPEGITKIGNNAFAGNNIKKITIPSTVTEIGNFAFSTKNYLKDECTLELPEGLRTIGSMAFRNKVIKEVALPSGVEELKQDVFLKEYSDGSPVQVTTVYISKAQYKNKEKFPASDYHVYKIKEDPEDVQWDEFDFTYASWKDADVKEEELTMYSVNNKADQIVLAPYLITGLSESGQEKIKRNKDMIIPAEDPDGNAVTGIAPGAFDDSAGEKKYGIESVAFPENVKVPYTASQKTRADELTERGNFVICSNAFAGNSLSVLKLPEGIIRIGEKAFEGNQIVGITVPKTVWWIDSRAFASNEITSVALPQDSDFRMNIGTESFAGNKIRAVQLPGRIERVELDAFKDNTGMEKVDPSAPEEWKNSGVVYMYAAPGTEAEKYIGHLGSMGAQHSFVQKLITDKTMPDELKPWGTEDFTYSEEGSTITGFSDQGSKKRVSNDTIILPDQGPDGKTIAAIGDAKAGECGLFGSAEKKTTTIIFPDKLERIGNYAFENCGLETIHFPKTLTVIGEGAFRQNHLSQILLPDHIKEAGAGAFAFNAAAGQIVISKAMTEIPAAFAENTGTTDGNILELVIPEGITAIGDNAFKGVRLSSIEIPSSVKTIGNCAFAQEERLGLAVRVVLSEGVEKIGNGAFQYAGVTELELPSTITDIENDAFQGCVEGGKVKLYTSSEEHVKKFNSSEYHEAVLQYLLGSGWSEDDFTYEGAAVTGWSEKGNQKRLENKRLVIPDRNPDTKEAITQIGDSAFKIPDEEITQLKDSVESPNGMTDVVIPKTVIQIGEKAFEYNNLETADFPDTLTVIGTSAFHGNKLKKAVFPDSVTSIGSGAFSENNLTEIVLPGSLKKLEKGVFSMNIRLEQIDLPDTLTEIDEMAFAGARFTSLTIPESVTKIGRKAFHLHHLKELTVPGNVKEIGESAFEGTFKAITLEKLTLEEGIESIGSKAFKEGYLKSVRLPSSLKYLAPDAFVNNSGTNNDHIVVCYTGNREHLKWPASDTYRIVLDGQKDQTQNQGEAATKIKVKKIKITGSSHKVAAGKKIRLKAEVSPSNASDKGVTWQSGNKKIASVNSKGIVTFKKSAGGKKVTITAIAKDGSRVKGTYKITAVKGVVKKITITGFRNSLKAGRSLKLKAKVTASKGAYKKVIWTSSNTKYAKVTASRKVKTYRAGKGKKVRITAKAADGSGKKKTVTIKLR